MGLSFAIPIDVAMEVVQQLKETGHVSRGWLGVTVQRVDRDLAESFGLDRAAGALITQVTPDSPAAESDLEVGDIIVQFDGKQIDLSSDLPHIVGRVTPETKVKAEVFRDGKLKRLDVTVGLLPDRSNARSGGVNPRYNNRLAIEVEDLDAEAKDRLAVAQGVLVTGVERGPAKTGDIRKGDVITTLDGDAMTSSVVFSRKVRDLPVNQAVHVRIIRNGNPAFRVIKITE